jgi:hypothetical protein
LGRPKTLQECRAIIRQRLETRETRFIQYVSKFIYGYPKSPYLPLLRLAGCELGDLAAMVRQRGLEPTLETLRDEGVYVAFEEFKGYRETVRSGRTFRFTQRDFDNPFRGAELKVLTGGTRSRGAPVYVALDSIAENRAICFSLMLDAAGVSNSPIITWLPGFPAGSGFFLWMGLAHVGRPPARWLAMTELKGAAVARHQRMLLPTARLIGRLRGHRLPEPEFVPLSASETVLHVLLAARRERGTSVLVTTPSAAVRVAAAAWRAGEPLSGITMLVGSEPLTPGKAEDINRTGAVVRARYIFTEGGAAGVGCGRPTAVDDMHFLADSFALILNRRTIDGVGVLHTYTYTALLNYAPKVMLNVESDDFGDFAIRHCGCPLDDLGLHHHFGNVRSFTKLTGEGAKVLGTDCIRILEEVLPREFGGSSVDYQLLEAEDEDHLTRLFLLVSPEVGPVDERAVLERFVQELGNRPYGNSPPQTWFQDQTIRVVRRHPVETRGGKLLPFHTQALGAIPDRTPAESGSRR